MQNGALLFVLKGGAPLYYGKSRNSERNPII